MKGLYHQACQDAGRKQDPAHAVLAVLGAPRRTFGIGITRTHYQCFDATRTMRVEALKRWPENLPKDDQRGIAFIQSASDPFSNVIFSSLPNAETSLTTTEFWSATQNKLGVPQSACASKVGKPIKTSGTGPDLKVDLFGNNAKSATKVTGDGHRTIHDNMGSMILETLEASGVTHRGGTHGRPRHCKGVFSAQVGSPRKWGACPKGRNGFSRRAPPARSPTHAVLSRPTQDAGKPYWENAASPTTGFSRELAAVAPMSQHPLNEGLQSTDANSAGRATM